jgi:hypothetical protein
LIKENSLIEPLYFHQIGSTLKKKRRGRHIAVEHPEAARIVKPSG